MQHVGSTLSVPRPTPFFVVSPTCRPTCRPTFQADTHVSADSVIFSTFENPTFSAKLTGGVGSADPHQIFREDVDPELVPEHGLPRVFMGHKGVPPRRGTLLRDLKFHPIDRHEAVVANVLDEAALKEDLLDDGGGQRGG
jgi:hypothetical protein